MPYEIEDIKPVGNRILVEIIHPDDVAVSGVLHTPRPSDKNIDKTYIAKVIKRGDRVSEEAKSYKRVLVSAYVNINSVRYVMIPEDEILAVLED